MSKQENNPLMAMLAQYEKATTRTNDSTYDETNYFSTYLPDGIDGGRFTIRILPSKDGSSPFQEVHLHSAKVADKNRKFVSLKHLNDEADPFQEIRTKLLSSGEKSDEEMAKKFNARLYYIIKIIDRDNEDHGPKFWRFPINYKKDGIFDKIMATIQTYKEDITNSETGRDLVLNVVRVKSPMGGSYPSVNTILALDKSPLSEDAELSQNWLNDEKTWKDVYAVKPYDYLKLVATGKTPAWDKTKECYVDKAVLDMQKENESQNVTNDLDSQITMGAGSKNVAQTKVVDQVVEQETSVATTVTEEEDDDLPF